MKERGVRAVDLPCSPNAHTRSIVFSERRCSSKRAVGDQSAHAHEKRRSKLGRSIALDLRTVLAIAKATAAIRPCIHRKSREATIHLLWRGNMSELGGIIYRASRFGMKPQSEKSEVTG
jgi:hypothetical protein